MNTTDMDFDAAGQAHYGAAEWEKIEAEKAALAAEEEDPGCHCCCCTGECRQQDDGSDVLFAGFEEGDLDG